MIDKINYISDDELERLILQVEQEELVAAPPDLMESILAKSTATRKQEFYAYCFRVITSVAAAIVLVFLMPGLTGRIADKNASSDFAQAIYQQEIPPYEDVVDPIPDKEEVVAAKTKTIPSKEEVLNKTGLFERVLRNTGWFNKKNEK